MFITSECAWAELFEIVPISIFDKITCFTFYDNHPNDDKHNIDVIVCTENEVKEFYRREAVLSTTIYCSSKPVDIRIFRNSKCELFYIVAAEDELLIFKRTDEYEILQIIPYVDIYEINDLSNSGQPLLKVYTRNDVVPLIFDENFERVKDKKMLPSSEFSDDILPIILHLNRKFTEVKYNMKCNLAIYEEFLEIRLSAAFFAHQKINPNLKDSYFHAGPAEAPATLELKSQTPRFIMCNQKLLIILYLSNNSMGLIENIHVVLHGGTNSVMEYTTKLFEESQYSPYWLEKQTHSLECNSDAALVVVIDHNEVGNNIKKKIVMNGIISYKNLNEEYLLPFENIIITAIDMMSEHFDVLANNNIGNSEQLLAILAASERTNLKLTPVLENDLEIQLCQLFTKYLKMDVIENTGTIVIHKISPYHILNGVMLVFHEKPPQVKPYSVSVYSRSTSQVLSLIHYINDAIPLKVVVTTADYRLCSQYESLSKYTEEQPTSQALSYENYANTILNQTIIIQSYLMECMSNMTESTNSFVRSKIGQAIDLYSSGAVAYMNFRNTILEDELQGIKMLGYGSNIRHD